MSNPVDGSTIWPVRPMAHWKPYFRDERRLIRFALVSRGSSAAGGCRVQTDQHQTPCRVHNAVLTSVTFLQRSFLLLLLSLSLRLESTIVSTCLGRIETQSRSNQPTLQFLALFLSQGHSFGPLFWLANQTFGFRTDILTRYRFVEPNVLRLS